jgi:LysR family transcriptional regulator, chromosome initiation inhibitor
MDLDPKRLEAFWAVCAQGSFSLAAVSLNMTLAAISIRIKGLESDLGQRLLIRGKSVKPTPSGQILLQHIQQSRLLEAGLREQLSGKSNLQALEIAVNADSLASWFLPGIAAAVQKNKLLLQCQVDDQEHTLALLKTGAVIGCVTTQKKAVAGCIAQPLGAMRYRCVASESFTRKVTTQGAVNLHQLLAQPAICFNRKDGLHDLFIEQHFGLKNPSYPKHYFPAVDAFHNALVQGLGWGIESTMQLPQNHKEKPLVDLFPGKFIDVMLYWQHWARESIHAAKLTAAIQLAAKRYLNPVAKRL